jgi:hypothetical protein
LNLFSACIGMMTKPTCKNKWLSDAFQIISRGQADYNSYVSAVLFWFRRMGWALSNSLARNLTMYFRVALTLLASEGIQISHLDAVAVLANGL